MCNTIYLLIICFNFQLKPPRTRDILRDCVYKAGLLDESKRQSNRYRLEFTTERKNFNL